MFGRALRARTLAGDVADLQQRLYGLERDVRRYASRASAGAVQASEQASDALVSALVDVIDRFRGSGRLMGGEAARFGHEAARLGNTAVRRLADEVEHRPLTMLAVVAALGFLIGLSSRRH